MNKLIVLLLLLPTVLFCQDIKYSKNVVKTLCSDEFKGRGYVEEGEKIAADYISKEFEKIGLLKFKNSYFQKFSTPVNTFPANMELTINGKTLVAGKDYLINADSPSLQGEFEVVNIYAKDIFNKNKILRKIGNLQGKVVVINTYNKEDFTSKELKKIKEFFSLLKYQKDISAVATIELSNNKLTWDGATSVSNHVNFTVVDSVVEKINTVSINVQNKFIKKYKTQNIIGYIEGERQDSFIVFVAHYDHLGMMGKDAIFPGANDNASGVAMLLSLANNYKKNKPKYNTIFMAFGGEELGLIGSKYFVNNPLFSLKKIKFLINFDITGTGIDGIQVVNGSIFQDKFDLMTKINDDKKYMKEVKIRGEACNSDHCVFYLKGVPCFYIYTLGGIKAYHDIYDKSETLPLTEFEDYHRLVVDFIDAL